MKLYRRTIPFIITLSLLLIVSGCSSNSNEETENDVIIETPTETMDSTTTEGESEEMIDEDISTDEIVEEVTWIEFTNEAKNFTLMYPSNWIIVDQESYGIVLRPNDETQTTFYVDVKTTEYSDYTYNDWIDEMVTYIKRIKPDAVFTEQVTIQINEYPFVNIDYTDTNDYGNWVFRNFYTANNNLGYKMYYGALDTEYDMYQPTMEEIALSFKFIQ